MNESGDGVGALFLGRDELKSEVTNKLSKTVVPTLEREMSYGQSWFTW